MARAGKVMVNGASSGGSLLVVAAGLNMGDLVCVLGRKKCGNSHSQNCFILLYHLLYHIRYYDTS